MSTSYLLILRAHGPPLTMRIRQQPYIPRRIPHKTLDQPFGRAHGFPNSDTLDPLGAGQGGREEVRRGGGGDEYFTGGDFEGFEGERWLARGLGEGEAEGAGGGGGDEEEVALRGWMSVCFGGVRGGVPRVWSSR